MVAEMIVRVLVVLVNLPPLDALLVLWKKVTRFDLLQFVNPRGAPTLGDVQEAKTTRAVEYGTAIRRVLTKELEMVILSRSIDRSALDLTGSNVLQVELAQRDEKCSCCNDYKQQPQVEPEPIHCGGEEETGQEEPAGWWVVDQLRVALLQGPTNKKLPAQNAAATNTGEKESQPKEDA